MALERNETSSLRPTVKYAGGQKKKYLLRLTARWMQPLLAHIQTYELA